MMSNKTDANDTLEDECNNDGIKEKKVKRNASQDEHLPGEPAGKHLRKEDTLVDDVVAGTSASSNIDGLEENLICIICQDIFYDCYSCQPCMHSFCGGCYSEWKQTSDECPACRVFVKSSYKCHILNNLVNAFLKAHPDKQRSEEEKKMLDAKNTLESQKPPSAELLCNDALNANNLIGTVLFHIMNARCRNCPDPDSGVVTETNCLPNSMHYKCSCCSELIPSTAPPTDTKCTMCCRFFCHIFWGCRRERCRGCIAKFKDMDVHERELDRLIKMNAYESNVLREYFQSKNIGIKDFVGICSEMLDSNDYINPGWLQTTSSSDSVCYSCSLKILQELAFHYLICLRDSDLPEDVTGRPNCHWGRMCRTQKTSQHHARRYNHICEQTRFNNDHQ